MTSIKPKNQSYRSGQGRGGGGRCSGFGLVRYARGNGDRAQHSRGDFLIPRILLKTCRLRDRAASTLLPNHTAEHSRVLGDLAYMYRGKGRQARQKSKDRQALVTYLGTTSRRR